MAIWFSSKLTKKPLEDMGCIFCENTLLLHANNLPYTQVSTHARTHTHARAGAHARTQAHTDTYTHAHTHARIQAHTHTRKHALTYTHAQHARITSIYSKLTQTRIFVKEELSDEHEWGLGVYIRHWSCLCLNMKMLNVSEILASVIRNPSCSTESQIVQKRKRVLNFNTLIKEKYTEESEDGFCCCFVLPRPWTVVE